MYFHLDEHSGTCAIKILLLIEFSSTSLNSASLGSEMECLKLVDTNIKNTFVSSESKSKVFSTEALN